MERALFSKEEEEEYGPCSCGAHRATRDVAIPISWLSGGEDKEEVQAILKANDFKFAMGYDHRRGFVGTSRQGKYLVPFSACSECCKRAEQLGIAEPGEF